MSSAVMQTSIVERDAQRTQASAASLKEQVKKERLPVLDGGLNTNASASEIAPNESPAIVNLFVVQGQLRVDTGYKTLGAFDAEGVKGTPQSVFRVNHSDGTVDTVLITTKAAYHLDTQGAWSRSDQTLNGEVNTPVSMVSYPPFDWVIITNGIDPVFYFYLGQFKVMPFDVPNIVCRSLGVFHEQLLLQGLTESGVRHPRRVRTSDAGSPTAIRTIIEGADTGIQAIYDLLDTDDDIHCGFPLGSWYILYRHTSIMRATYLGVLNQILFWEYMIQGDGAQSVLGVAPITIARTPAIHVVVGAFNVYAYKGDYALEPLADNIWQQHFSVTSNLNQMAKGNIWAQYVANWHEVWIGIPTGEYTIPDTVLRLALGGKPGWFVRRFADQWLSAGSQLMRFEEDTAAPGVLLAGPGGVVEYDFVVPDDRGQLIRWSVETKDVGEGGTLSRFDRLLVRGQGAFDIGVEVSLDRGRSWRFVDVIDFRFAALAGVTFQFVSEYLRVRLSGNDPSFRMTWMEIWSEFEGEWVPMQVLAPQPPAIGMGGTG